MFAYLDLSEYYSPPHHKTLAFNYIFLLLSLTACSEQYYCIFLLHCISPQLVLQNLQSCQNWELLFHLDSRQRGTRSITAAGHPCYWSPFFSSSNYSEPGCNNTSSAPPSLKDQMPVYAAGFKDQTLSHNAKPVSYYALLCSKGNSSA